MQLPPLLVERIEEARAAMSVNPRWDLPLGYRYRIYYALEPDPNSDPADPDLNVYEHPRLGHLGIATTRKVLSVWLELFPAIAARLKGASPDNPLLQVYPDLVKQVIAGIVPMEEVNAIINRAEHTQETKENAFSPSEEREESSRSLMVQLTVSTALAIKRDGVHFSQFANICKPVWRQIEWESHDPDPEQWAVQAYAGIDERFDPKKSREFWTWWLDEAVPTAWRAVSET